jgi:hypothetical protein
MTRNTFAVQASAARACELLPGELTIGADSLHISPKPAGTELRRYAARWTRGPVRGNAYVEIKAPSKGSSEITVALEPAGTLGRFFGSRVLKRMGEQFARALQYEIETRVDEESDALAVRRTTAARVRERIA